MLYAMPHYFISMRVLFQQVIGSGSRARQFAKGRAVHFSFFYPRSPFIISSLGPAPTSLVSIKCLSSHSFGTNLQCTHFFHFAQVRHTAADEKHFSRSDSEASLSAQELGNNHSVHISSRSTHRGLTEESICTVARNLHQV